MPSVSLSEHDSIVNLRSLLDKAQLVAHKKHRETLCQVVLALIQSRSVHFCEWAAAIDSEARPASVERRIQRFFSKVSMEGWTLARLLLGFLHHDKLLLTLDRTNWQAGSLQVNILCIAVSVGRLAVPVYFRLLGTQGEGRGHRGNSRTEERIELLDELLQVVGHERVEALVMDREFVGQVWLKALKQRGVDFCVRVPGHHRAATAEGRDAPLRTFRAGTRRRDAIVDGVSANLSVSRGADGERLCLLGTFPPEELPKVYRRRWGIEAMFQAMKKRGFDLEASRLRDLGKYRVLFALVSVAYALCWATGIESGRTAPVRPKKNGYPQYSVFRRGLNIIRNLLKNRFEPAFSSVIALVRQRMFGQPNLSG